MSKYLYGTNFVFDSRSNDDVTISAGAGQNLIIDGAIESSAPKSFMSLYRSQVVVASYVLNAWTTLDLTGLSSTSSNFSASASGVLTYTGTTTKNFIAETNISVFSAAGVNMTINFGFDKNSSGSVEDKNVSVVSTPINNNIVGSSLGFFTLATGDTLTFKVKNTTNTTGLTFNFVQLYVSEI